MLRHYDQGSSRIHKSVLYPKGLLSHSQVPHRNCPVIVKTCVEIDCLGKIFIGNIVEEEGLFL
jgi:hypothetical protein